MTGFGTGRHESVSLCTEARMGGVSSFEWVPSRVS